MKSWRSRKKGTAVWLLSGIAVAVFLLVMTGRAEFDGEHGIAIVQAKENGEDTLKDGEYSVTFDMEGGSGKATVVSPTLMTIRDGNSYVRIEWSSSNYDYMLVENEKYLNTSEEGANSVFEIPIVCWDKEMTVIADTTAMGTPHEIEYTFVFYRASVGSKGQLPQEAAKRVVVMSLIIIVGGGILDYYVKKRWRQQTMRDGKRKK